MKIKELQKSAKWPQKKASIKALQRQIEFGEFGEMDFETILPVITRRYLITYMSSQGCAEFAQLQWYRLLTNRLILIG